MARGWESKGVEQQQEEKALASQPARPKLQANEIRNLQRRQTLLLTRSQILDRLGSSTRPERRKTLEIALAELDSELQRLDS